MEVTVHRGMGRSKRRCGSEDASPLRRHIMLGFSRLWSWLAGTDTKQPADSENDRDCTETKITVEQITIEAPSEPDNE